MIKVSYDVHRVFGELVENAKHHKLFMTLRTYETTPNRSGGPLTDHPDLGGEVGVDLLHRSLLVHEDVLR